MRCLFCGKELALLHRLRGGGEFCSEAHRKEYQEQYEQLGLARLLQAKPPAESTTPPGQPSSAPPVAADAILENPRNDAPVQEQAQQFNQVQHHHAVAMSEPPPPPEEAGPAPLAGFVGESLAPAVTAFQRAVPLELESAMERGANRSSGLPTVALVDTATWVDTASEGCLGPAPPVELALSLQALDHHTRASERSVEVRDFAGPAPVMELHPRTEAASEPGAAADAMEILMSPHPPQKAAPWLGAPRGFSAAPTELGQLARLDFAPSGFAYADGPVSAAPAPIAGSPSAAAVLTPEAPPTEAASAEPPAPVAVLPPAEPEPPALVTPALVTKTLPVTLHGLAAPRGKLAQTYTSAIAAASDVLIPASSALPLRPVIVFGPAPAPAPESAAAPVQAKPEQAKPEQPKPVAKPEQNKQVQPEPESHFRSSVVPAPRPVPVKRSAAPESIAPVVNAASDAAMLSLHLEAESAWSRLSTGVKIGIAAAVIVGLSGIAYLVTRGGGTTSGQAVATATPSVAAGVPIPGGWIDDWADAARTNRHISVLSGSAKLSDYRVELDAQIQTKAIGWIFRGLNPRNYYVNKLEIIKPGLEPTVALVHFAVVDGHDESRVVVPLPMKVRVDTTYKIRSEAVGNRFTTWIQGQKIDEWTDSRFGSGGVGLFSEGDEQAALQGNVNVVALVPKN